MYKILICEEYIGQKANELFIDYEYDIALNQDDIFAKTYEKKYDLYIVNFSFYQVIKELRKFEDSTITIFIDDYYDIYHIKKAFEVGDEYLIKPLNLEELNIRVLYYYKKLYRDKSKLLRYKDFFFHTKTKQLYKGNKKIKLSPNETTLVELFLSSPNTNLLKYTLLDEINSTSDGTLRVYISKLKKLGFDIEFTRSTNSYMLLLLC
jgi:DNA-binding response OmpR family regulator